MRRKFFKIGLLLTAMVLIAIGVALLFPTPRSPLARPLPNPNGYTFLLEAGRMIPRYSGNFLQSNEEPLRAFVAANTNALELAREGLKFECQVPLEYSHAYSSNHLDQLRALRNLAWTFVAEGRLAEIEQRTNDAAKSYLDIGRLGVKSAHGGIIIDAMIGTATEGMGDRLLQQLLHSVDAKTCREIAQTLQSLESEREPWNKVAEQNSDWSQRVNSSLKDQVGRLVTIATSRRAMTDAEQRFNEQLVRTRRLMIDFAARAYELENDRKPTGFADLVPGYLKSIPEDPLTGTNIVFVGPVGRPSPKFR